MSCGHSPKVSRKLPGSEKRISHKALLIVHHALFCVFPRDWSLCSLHFIYPSRHQWPGDIVLIKRSGDGVAVLTVQGASGLLDERAFGNHNYALSSVFKTFKNIIPPNRRICSFVVI